MMNARTLTKAHTAPLSANAKTMLRMSSRLMVMGATYLLIMSLLIMQASSITG